MERLCSADPERLCCAERLGAAERAAVLVACVAVSAGAAWAAWGTLDSAFLAGAFAVISVVLWLFRPLARGDAEAFRPGKGEGKGEGEAEGANETIEGMSAVVYSSVFGGGPVEDGVWGRFRLNQERSPAPQIPEGAALKRSGVPTLNRSVIGPHASSLGLSSSDGFTAALVLRFEGFGSMGSGSGSDPAPAETLLHIPSSTPSDAALLHVAKIDVSYGSSVRGTRAHNVTFAVFGGESSASAEAVVDTDKTYMFVLTRDGPSFSARMYELSPAWGEKGSGGPGPEDAVVLAAIPDAQQGLALSNQPVVINASGRLDARAFAVAVFDRPLTKAQEAKLHEHFVAKLRDALDPGMRAGGCPYGEPVCSNKYCAGVDDWSRPEQFVDSRAECKAAVDAWCRDNPDHPSCYCWSKDDTRASGEDCKRWLAFVRRAPIPSDPPPKPQARPLPPPKDPVEDGGIVNHYRSDNLSDGDSGSIDSDTGSITGRIDSGSSNSNGGPAEKGAQQDKSFYRFPSAVGVPSAARARESAETPNAPAETPKGPADTPKRRAETPKGPAETPKGRAETPKDRAETPQGNQPSWGTELGGARAGNLLKPIDRSEPGGSVFGWFRSLLSGDY